MRSLWGVAVLFLAHAATASAQADLQVTGFASPATDLVPGQHVLVSTTITNNGPVGAAGGSVSVSGQYVYFDFIGSETAGCEFDFYDFSPPSFNYAWSYPALASGESYTCAVQLRVREFLSENPTVLSAGIDGPPDEVPANDRISVTFAFRNFSVARRHTVPTASYAGLALLAIAIALSSLFASIRGRA